MAWIASDSAIDGYSLVQGYWRTVLGPMYSDRVWRRWLHDGVVNGIPRAGISPSPREVAALIAALGKVETDAGKFEINFHSTPSSPTAATPTTAGCRRPRTR
jgi:hypothetical protein